MTWDLGLQGLGTLALMAIVFGLFAQLVAARYTTVWVGVIAAAAYFAVGLVISEAWFGWATAEELQPNIDGLSFDEVLLAWLPGIAALLFARHVGRKHHASRATSPFPPAEGRRSRSQGQRHADGNVRKG